MLSTLDSDKWKSPSRVWLFVTTWTIQSMEFSRILEWVAVTFSRDLPNPGTEPRSPTLQTDSLPSKPQGKLNDEFLIKFKDRLHYAYYCVSISKMKMALLVAESCWHLSTSYSDTDPEPIRKKERIIFENPLKAQCGNENYNTLLRETEENLSQWRNLFMDSCHLFMEWKVQYCK